MVVLLDLCQPRQPNLFERPLSSLGSLQSSVNFSLCFWPRRDAVLIESQNVVELAVRHDNWFRSKLTHTMAFSLDGAPGPETEAEVHAALRTSEGRQRSVKELGMPWLTKVCDLQIQLFVS